MNTILDIWNLIVHSNTFNFIVMLLILGWLVSKFKIAESLDVLKNNIIDSIEKAKQEKFDAQKVLSSAQDEVKNLDSEIKSRLSQAEEHAKTVAQRIIDDTENKVKQIEANIERVVEAEEKTISSRLTGKTAKASIELAKNHITNLLKQHPELHDKYINDSINEIDRIKI